MRRIPVAASHQVRNGMRAVSVRRRSVARPEARITGAFCDLKAWLKEAFPMPLATIKVIEGIFSGDEKQRMIEKVTEAMISVEGENLRDKTVVIVEEVRSGDWGIGGRTITSEDVKQLRARR
jgi:4-oxalocrotonate tautomerase